ncbi:MAG TPA: hypothetical protein VJS11_04480 [Acidobacteriaceae bacterium]|nr:hypothetical protein [Acidobacteriaceae bacterium]
MKRTCVLVLAVVGCGVAAAQQTPPVPWQPVKFLLGHWVGEGNSETEQAGAGSCSFEPDLQNKVLIRRNHAEYPAADGHPAIAHDDLMVIYPDAALHQLRAFYTDNEGHVIHYTVTAGSDGLTAVFLGDTEPGHARYRLTYALTQSAHMTITLEMAASDKPDQFRKIIDGKMRRSDVGSASLLP